jgi:hypothetical protein
MCLGAPCQKWLFTTKHGRSSEIQEPVYVFACSCKCLVSYAYLLVREKKNSEGVEQKVLKGTYQSNHGYLIRFVWLWECLRDVLKGVHGIMQTAVLRTLWKPAFILVDKHGD